MVGYPFVNPGAVGGVGHFKDKQAGNLEAENELEMNAEEKMAQLELYIRWWQLNTFLPMLHFVKPPSAFEPETISKVADNLKKIRY